MTCDQLRRTSVNRTTVHATMHQTGIRGFYRHISLENALECVGVQHLCASWVQRVGLVGLLLRHPQWIVPGAGASPGQAAGLRVGVGLGGVVTSPRRMEDGWPPRKIGGGVGGSRRPMPTHCRRCSQWSMRTWTPPNQHVSGAAREYS